MGLKNDAWIRRMANEQAMITPFAESLKQEGVISYGVGSYGYDVRVADEYLLFEEAYGVVIDPKAFNPAACREIKTDLLIMPPNSFALARTVEYIRMPRNVHALCMGKSTYARCGVVLNITPIEAAWEGHITLELSNTTPLPVKIYSNEGIVQLQFIEGDEAPEVSYADRAGKYQGQRGITVAKVKAG